MPARTRFPLSDTTPTHDFLGRRADLDAEVVDLALRETGAAFVEVDGHPAQRGQRAVDLSETGGVQVELEGIPAPANELPVPEKVVAGTA